MPSSSLLINQIALDDEFYVWGSGQDLRRFNGSNWEYYDYTNSAVPSSYPYSLDTRSISIDPEQKIWCGCAQGLTSGFSETSVFWIDSNNVSIGKKWEFSDLGNFTEPQEVSLVYGCPFGDDTLAFVTPLNGIGGTSGISSYTRINGVTGGRLFYYLKETDQWKETVEDYTWPHIFSIETKGFDGKGYYYYIGTSEGLFVVPQGSLEYTTLSNGFKYIKQAIVYNTHTSGIISDMIYCLDFDENGNLWIGTDSGLSFFDGSQFWNYPTQYPVTSIKSRENGHVFYSLGDGELSQGTGIWHFNGTTHTQFTSSNSSLSSNNILQIELIEHSNTQESVIIRENDLWILEYNYLSRFGYDIPHVYASSKYAGATGWNFVYYNPTGGEPPLPHVNKYTWSYPEWLIYETEYLSKKFPGLDPRNLFLTTNLKDIADGKAGTQAYWNNWPLPSFESSQISESFQDSKWNDVLSYISGASGSINMIRITSSTVQEFQNEKKYYIAGYFEPDISSGNYSVQFGYYSDSTPAILSSCNPTINSNFSSVNNTVNNAKTGFIVSYSESGNVDAILPLRGFSTEVQSLCASQDGLYIFASGIFDKYMEVGEYLWGAYEYYPGPTGPTGAPLGVTNYSVPGATSYSWIGNPSTSSSLLNATWDIYPGTQNYTPSGGIDFSFYGITAGSTGTYENLETVYVNFVDSGSTNRQTSLITTLTGSALQISLGSESAVYRIDSPSYKDPDSVAYSVTYQSGDVGLANYATGGTATINIYSRHSSVYPYTLYNQSINPDSTGIFVIKIGRDLGSTSSFSDINGVTGDYYSSVRKKYRVEDFRYFPPISLYPGGTAITKIDSTKYYLNLAVSHSSSSPVLFSTLKNQWNRNDDLDSSNSYFGDPDSNSFGSYIKLDIDNLSLVQTYTTSGATSGFYINSIKSNNDESSVLLTGQSTTSFNMFGLSVDHPTGSSNLYSYPFYVLGSPTGMGLTGSIVNIGGTSSFINIDKISADKGNSVYHVTTVFGGRDLGLTGSYFGKQINFGSTGQNYLCTATVTEMGLIKNLSQNQTYVLDPEMGIKTVDFLDNGQNFISYEINTPGITGYNFAILKCNDSSKNLDFETFESFEGDITFSSDSNSNILISGINTSGTTGSMGSLFNCGPTSGISTLLNQYYPELGINLGNIISRPGSGAWTWCDVHSTDSYMEVPLLSTVVFNNYASNIYGKNSNKWIISNSQTGQELLNVKETPYFIYTFTDPGYYTIYNQVEDSAGNVYQVSKPGFIRVINHREKRPDDPRPERIDSGDYGYPGDDFYTRDYLALKLDKDLMKEQAQIVNNSRGQFGSGIVIPDDPDATFNY